MGRPVCGWHSDGHADIRAEVGGSACWQEKTKENGMGLCNQSVSIGCVLSEGKLAHRWSAPVRGQAWRGVGGGDTRWWLRPSAACSMRWGLASGDVDVGEMAAVAEAEELTLVEVEVESVEDL